VFQRCDTISEIVLVVPKSDVAGIEQSVVKRYKFDKVCRVAAGGAERQDTVYKGIRAIKGPCDVVCIHDGVRPFVTARLIDSCVRTAAAFGAAIVAVPVKDTIKIASEDGCVLRTPERETLWPRRRRRRSSTISWRTLTRRRIEATL